MLMIVVKYVLFEPESHNLINGFQYISNLPTLCPKRRSVDLSP